MGRVIIVRIRDVLDNKQERTSRVQKGEKMYAANFHIKEHY